MCGICGVVSLGDRRDSDLAPIVQPMMAAMWHRGPDASGHLEEPGVALGMRRLSIIDRAMGSQPFWNEDRTVAVIFNGEIYNFEQLRQELTRLGHHFRSRSDTEAIVHAFEQWDGDCLTRLRGMFALAIYDGPRRRLLLARDRLGIKPLYYTRVNGRLLFASEVRALLASGVVPREVSREGLDSYLLFGSVSEPETLIEGVRSLPPGHALHIPIGEMAHAGRNGCEPRAYWTLPVTMSERTRGARNGSASNGVSASASTPSPASAPASAPARELRALLEDSIRLHLISDEPLGVFLSGGVDSTAIASLASRARAGVCCYTVSFREREFDESDVARRTAKRLGVEHRELLVEAEDMLEGLDDALGALDQPSVDGINTYCVSAAVRRAGVKVALSGLGGDELFGGYRTFRWMPALGRLSTVARHTPHAMRSAGAHAISRAGAWIHRPEETDRLASLWREPDALPHPFFFARTVFGPGEAGLLMRRPGNDGAASAFAFAPPLSHDAWRQWNDDTVRVANGAERFTAVSYLELRSYMLNTLLRDSDAMSMAHSLELRVPLLDHPIVEFVAAQPDAIKQRNGAYKPLLVEALGDLLPPEVSERPKRGFTFPWATWMRGPLAPRVTARLSDLPPALDCRLDRDAVAATWTAFQAGRYGWLRPWSLYVLNEWVRRHL